MGSLIMHFGITKILSEKYNLKNEILLGSILPDILKISKLETKEESHYIEKESKLPNINRYIDTNMKCGYNLIKMGYLFHLIQDKIWYQYLNELENNFNGEHINFENRIYSDMNICDKFILNKLNIDEEKFAELKMNLEKLSNNKKIQQCINKSFRIREIENEHIYFVTEGKLKKYIQESIDSCEEYYTLFINQYK